MALPLAPGQRAIPIPGSAVATEPTESIETTEPALRTHRRFDRAARLFGEPALHELMHARVLVFGMGGVGSFAAEALARSGVGTLCLVDFDDICVTNANRQLHALKGNIGRKKVDVMAERLRRVHPPSVVEAVAEFYEAETSERLLRGRVDYVVDAIDNLAAKAHLIATCRARSIPVVSSMGAAARMDPTAIRVADLSDTTRDPFASALRKILRKRHGMPCMAGEASGVEAVYSIETPRPPAVLSYDTEAGFQCVCPSGKNGKHTCDRRSRIDGSAAFVAGAFGLACASVVVRAYTPPPTV
ncbi:MAG: tRNA threonylcarbamoyladenosine dehydratase [Deltaproteobacteria bacterium]|nr:tRNA threonylcarbamoyladenosine dehydratase [Deltaproteobacteria bacterium]